MPSPPSTRTKVFISYSHADQKWLDRLNRHLKPLVREGLDCWDDTRIQPGADWRQEIRHALDAAQIAVLVISADFFASDFIATDELPPLLAAAEAKGVLILPVIISASRFERTPSLARFQAVNSTDRPLTKMPPAEQEDVLDYVAQIIENPPQPPCISWTLRRGRPSDVSAQQADNRHRILKLVRKIWIDDYLKHSLDNLAASNWV